MMTAPVAFATASQISLLKTLDIHLAEIGDRHAVMTVTVAEKHLNYLGGAHGGLLATLADTVAFFPRPLLPAGRNCTTTNLHLAYLKPAALGDKLSARAELLHLGRRTASVQVHITNQFGKLIAHGTTSLMLLDA